MKRRIAVIGHDAKLDPNVWEMAEQVGRDVARAGCILVCGGRGGVMEAACRGAKSEGGLTVGILPSLDGGDANDFVDIMITTGIGYARNALVVSSADAVIAINGSTGTLSEIGMALNFGRPVIIVKGSGGVSERIKAAFPDDALLARIVEASAEEAVAAATKRI
jgi:uncharacterized protein (TIGR00725 family)